MVSIDELIRKAQELKPLPASAVRLAAAVNSGSTHIDEICEIIAYDQALTLRLLRAANSADSASQAPIKQVHDAVFRLGNARILSLAIAANVSVFLKEDASAYGLSEGALWKHSVAAAATAETLPQFVNVTLPPETFTAALLHDIGKLVMSRFLSLEDLQMIHRAQIEGHLDPLAAETQILTVHHGELGGIIAQHWKLPESIVKGIIYHHAPAEGQSVICDAVYLSNILSKRFENLAEPPNIDAEVLVRLGILESEIDPLTISSRGHFDNVSARYNAA